nr:MAG TPA: hypothetical protein [Caudoviricetes sp.]
MLSVYPFAVACFACFVTFLCLGWCLGCLLVMQYTVLLSIV